MTNWVRIDEDIAEHPKTQWLAEKTGLDIDTCVGKLVRLFLKVGRFAPSGDLRSVSFRTIEAWANWQGEPGVFWMHFVEHFVSGNEITGWMHRNGKIMQYENRERGRKAAVARKRRADGSADSSAESSALRSAPVARYSAESSARFTARTGTGTDTDTELQEQDQKPLSSHSENGVAVATVSPNGQLPARASARDVSAVRARIALYLDGARDKALTKGKLRTLQVETVFAYWAAKHRKTKRTLLDEKRVALIGRRLNENGSDVSELLYAIDGSLRDKTLTEGGYDQLSTILRDRQQVERLAGLMPKYDAGELHEMAVKVLGAGSAPAQPATAESEVLSA